ncbi:MAG: hypothetical protein H0Z18_10545 [Thermococcus sp.]|uniref:hypothetical protein n=1 Tax=Thermococcus sp. TaxID=35749 RepID=UPI001DF0EDA1|nr:hypothetical protein [Thermococcus sp.]MBO8175684.1 hypothetical protein [Thermococcus sp.]
MDVQKVNWISNNEIDKRLNAKHASNVDSIRLVGNYTCDQKAALLMNLRDFKIKGEHMCPLDWLRINWTFEVPRSYKCYYAIKVHEYYFASFYYTDHTKALQSYENFISALKKKYPIQEENIPLKDNAYSMCGNSFVDSKNVLFKTQDGYIYVELLRLSNDRAVILVVIGDETIWHIINAKK